LKPSFDCSRPCCPVHTPTRCYPSISPSRQTALTFLQPPLSLFKPVIAKDQPPAESMLSADDLSPHNPTHSPRRPPPFALEIRTSPFGILLRFAVLKYKCLMRLFYTTFPHSPPVHLLRFLFQFSLLPSQREILIVVFPFLRT